MSEREPGFVRVGFRRAGQASGGGGGTITSIVGSSPIHVANGTGPTVTISHDPSGIVAGEVAYPVSVTFDADGHATAATGGAAPVASVGVTAPITLGGTATAPVIGHAASGIAAGEVAYPASVTFDADGHATAATAGNTPLTRISTQTGTGTSVGFSWTALQYPTLKFVLTWSGTVSVTALTLTGMAAFTYREVDQYVGINPTTAGQVSNYNVSQWMVGGSSNGPGKFEGWIEMPPAPLGKSMRAGEYDGSYSRLLNAFSTDTTNDPTGLLFTFSGSAVYRLVVWG